MNFLNLIPYNPLNIIDVPIIPPDSQPTRPSNVPTNGENSYSWIQPLKIPTNVVMEEKPIYSKPITFSNMYAPPPLIVIDEPPPAVPAPVPVSVVEPPVVEQTKQPERIPVATRAIEEPTGAVAPPKPAPAVFMTSKPPPLIQDAAPPPIATVLPPAAPPTIVAVPAPPAPAPVVNIPAPVINVVVDNKPDMTFINENMKLKDEIKTLTNRVEETNKSLISAILNQKDFENNIKMLSNDINMRLKQHNDDQLFIQAITKNTQYPTAFNVAQPESSWSIPTWIFLIPIGLILLKK